MKTLFIDTHFNDINVILFNNDSIIKENHVYGEKHNSKYVLNSIKNVCNGQSYDQIVVVNGPGSFTGVRIGVTIAKTLAYTLKIPIKPISFLDILHICNNSSLVAISDDNGFYVGDYEKNINYYLSNVEFKNYILHNNVDCNLKIDYKKIIKYISHMSPVVPHLVNPVYIKKISVEYDKKYKQ